ncbi:hypothetical protein SAMN05421823_101597 [Catalinimonas alkaloidigena]|uniref:Uncharacterized protein n=1 Tax=Catalinimonas alkaloidigena TaxID=1075417 RepID=A0A1G8Y892_9BACT|nr:hypothetical protein [Catalinimonas alkaloidigena]SDJ99016.1 hypothetical protein SAMN05421823_101597 [Catalinimonas alkaloidigena]
MSTKTLLLSSLAFLLVLTLGMALRPVPHVPEAHCRVVEGRVRDVRTAGEHDVVLALEGTAQCFYINRGLETGLTLEEWQTRLLNREVEIKYPSYWTPLDPTNALRHVAQLRTADEVIFSEWQD